MAGVNVCLSQHGLTEFAAGLLQWARKAEGIDCLLQIGQSVADIAIFVIFNVAAVTIVVFSKIRNFNLPFSEGARFASACQISSKSVRRLRRYGDLTVFQNGGRAPSRICWVRIWTTHDEHLVVFSVVQTLAGIDAVVLVICRFQYFAL